MKNKPRRKLGRPATGIELSAGDLRAMRGARVARRLTQEGLAVILGVSLSRLRSWEIGERRVQARDLARWAICRCD